MAREARQGRWRRSQGMPAMVAADLRQAILSSELAAGTQLRQDHLAADYGVSHIPVREAMRRLEAEGLVTYTPRRGVFVARLSGPEAWELTEMRLALEGLAVRLSVARATAGDFEAAAEALGAGDRSASLDDRSAMNWAFHRALYAPCERPRLIKTVEGLWRQVDRYLRVVWQTADYQDRSQDEHRAILAAYRRRDVETALALTEAHIREAGEVLLRFMEEAEAGNG